MFSACLWPWCDPEDGQPRKKPPHSNSDTRLPKQAVQANPLWVQAECLGRKMDAIVILQGE
jgi:hypothetical protein